jgi:hypothetical protein
MASYSDVPLKAHPVVLYDKADKDVIRADLVSVCEPPIGAGPVDKSRGAPLLVGGWMKNPDVAFGLHFDLSTWKGHDVFSFSNYPGVYITRRVVDAIRAIPTEGVVMTPLSEFRRNLRDQSLANVWRRAPHLLPPEYR